MQIPSHLHTVDDFIGWLKTASSDRRVGLWAEQLRLQMEAYIDHDALCDHLGDIIDRSGVTLQEGYSYQAALDAIMERYEACRAASSEWLDHDIASVGHAAETEKLMRTLHEADEFRSNVRAALVRTTAFRAEDGDDYAQGLLCALLGVSR